MNKDIGILLAEREKMTEREEQILYGIMRYQNRYGFAPSVRELCMIVGLASTSTVYWHLKNLEQKGYLSRRECTSRAIAVL